MYNRYEIVEYSDVLPVRTGFWPIDSVHLHWHQEIEILFVLKGSVNVMIQNNAHIISEGEIIVISPNLMHATQQTEEPNLAVMLQINCDKFSFRDAMIDTMIFKCKGSERDHPKIAQIRQSICAIMLETAYKHPGYQYAAASHVQSILSTLLRYFPHEERESIETVKPRDRERMQRIFKHIDENHAGKIMLADIAEKEYLSVNHLSTFIKRMIGMNFGEYVNTVRMKAFLERLQCDDTTPIDDIADQCGFSSPQYATALFAKQYRTTPGRYRKQLQQRNAVRASAMDAAEGDAFAAVYQPTDLAELLHYWQEDTAKNTAAATHATEAQMIQIDARGAQGIYHKSCVRYTAIGRAYEGLLSHVQEALRQARRDIGFTHVKFHGLLSDDMMILKADNVGTIHYSWRLVDALFDFLLSVGLRPFIELTYMPTLLASGSETVFAWHGNITPPASMKAWAELIHALVRHCVQRYGEMEVEKWYFEVWNEPDFAGVSWTGTEQEFFQFYAETAKAVKAECAGAKICGPSVTAVGIRQRKWVPAFAEYCRRHRIPVDAFSLHTYSEILDSSNLYNQLQDMIERRDARTPAGKLMGQQYAKELLGMVEKQLDGQLDVPYVVTEWNLTLATFSPINDSAFAATSMLATALACDAENLHMIHWTLTDYMEEQHSLPPQELHGGFGLLTVHGVKKPSYWAMWMLARLGGEVVARLENGIVTRQGNAILLLAYHHPVTSGAYDMAYAQAFSQNSFFQLGAIHQIWKLSGLEGKYRVRRYCFDAEQCDAKTVVHMRGMREIMEPEDATYLSQVAQPLRSETTLVAQSGGEGLEISFTLNPCSFELVELTPEPM